MDTYQLKTQNGIISLELKYFDINKINNKYFIIQKNINKPFKETLKDQTPEEGYDFVIDCTGFVFDDSIFNKKIRPKTNGKVPIIKPNFESENVSNLFMAGTLMQYISWKKSSGAFVHGFRYLVRCLLRMETDNLKKYINGIRVDVIAKDEFKHEFENGKMQIQKEFLNFEEAKLAMIEADSKMNIDKHSFQKWFFGHGTSVNAELQLLSSKIVENIYDISSDKLNHNASITYYEPGCFLRKHQDGYTGGRICVVLIYLNDSDYKPEWGGNLVFNDDNTIAPLYGNIAVLDFKSHNAFHEVKKVTDGYGRYAFLDFISTNDVN